MIANHSGGFLESTVSLLFNNASNFQDISSIRLLYQRYILIIVAWVSFCCSCYLTSQLYRERKAKRKLGISCQDTVSNNRYRKALQRVGEYEPPWWYNRHLGTCVPFGYNPNLIYEREIFSAIDGCFAVDWYPCKPRERQYLKICVFYPGLGLGSANVSLK